MKRKSYLRIPAITASAVIPGLLLLVALTGDAKGGDEKSLELAGSYKSKESNGASWVCIAGKRACIIGGDSAKGLSALDISNPRKPKVESNIKIPNPAFEGAYYGFMGLLYDKPYIYTYDSKDNFWVIKVSRKKLQVAGKVLQPEHGGASVTWGYEWFRYDSPRVYAKTVKGIRIYDVKSARNPKLAGILEIEKLESYRVSGKHLLARTPEGLSYYNVSNPGKPGKPVPVCEKPSGYCIEKDMLYVTEKSKGLSVYSLDGIKEGKPEGACIIEGSGLEVLTACGDCAWVKFYREEKVEEESVKKFYLQCVDVSDPTKPVPAGIAEFESQPDLIAVKDTFAVVVTREKHLAVLDFDDRKNLKTLYYFPLQPICKFPLPHHIEDFTGLDVDDKYIYVWNCSDTILIFNLPEEMK